MKKDLRREDGIRPGRALQARQKVWIFILKTMGTFNMERTRSAFCRYRSSDKVWAADERQAEELKVIS